LINHDEFYSKNHNNENGKRQLNGNYESDETDRSSPKLSCRNEISSFESAVANNKPSISTKLTKSISNLVLKKCLIEIEPDVPSLACSSNSIATTEITLSEDSINQNNLTANNDPNFTEDFEIIDVSIKYVNI